ncbi:MAG: ThuA domain-containing protein [Phycisphaerales bacterium]|nr:ThuA domain-containing protein [Planctomycetota bacterium]MCH8509623.1 ThuA domain-containing protein [Phycisphaerales bacterium]
MPIRIAAALLCLLIAFGAFARMSSAPEHPEPAADEPFGVLVFTKTAGFRHDSIPDGVRALRELGPEGGFRVHHTEDSGVFTDETLGGFRVIVFLNTTGTILDEDQKRAMERFIRAGNGFVGIHSAADTEYDWAWYGRLVGAYFRSHPPTQPAEIDVIDRDHPSTRHLPERWARTDEWYDFRSRPADTVRVLMNLDESTYEGGRMGEDHPIAWCHAFDGGRAFYTAGGHTKESFAEPDFRRHLLGGIRWAAGEDDPDGPVRTETETGP